MSKKKKYGIWAIGILLSPILLIILLTLLLYLPPVQNWAVRQVSSYASEATGMEISVARVNLAFPLRLEVNGVKALQPIDSLKNVSNLSLRNKKDTVADIQRMLVDVQLMPLFEKQVMVDELHFSRLKVNTTNFIHEARIKGEIGNLSLKAHGIDLSREHVNVNHAYLADAKLSVELSDTVPPDTTPSTNHWKIDIQRLKLKNTDFVLRMPGDTLQVRAFLGDALAQHTYLDLFKGLYRVRSLIWDKGSVRYDNYASELASGKSLYVASLMQREAGMDFNHIALSNMALKADSFYFCDSKIDVRIREARFMERGGLKVSQLNGRFAMDSTKLQLPDLNLRTPMSAIHANVSMDMDAFAVSAPGKLNVALKGQIGKEDLMLFAGSYLPAKMRAAWPYYPLSVDATLRGNLQFMSFPSVKLSLPTAFSFNANGTMAHLADASRLKLQAAIDARTYHLGILTSLLDPALMQEIRIPYGLALKGNVNIGGSRYATSLAVAEGKGRMNIQASVATRLRKDGSLDMSEMAYQAKIKAVNLQAKHFLPRQELYAFTGDLEVKGKGTDILSPRTYLDAHAQIGHVHYAQYKLDHVKALAKMSRGRLYANIDSKNYLLNGKVTFDALTNSKVLDGTVVADVKGVNLYALGLTKAPMEASVCGYADVKSDLGENHKLQAMLSDIAVKTVSKTYHPVDVLADIYTRRDTTHAILDCGDFHLKMDTHGGYKILLSQVDKLQKEVISQMKERRIDQVRIRQKFPLGHISLSTGKDNFISRFIEYNGVQFKNVAMDMTTSPLQGINGYLNIDSLVTQGVQLDTIRATITTEGDTIRYATRIQNNLKNPQYVFKALVNGELSETGSDVKAQVFDAKNKLGVSVGLAAMMLDDGIKVSLTDTHPILGYKRFTANSDNYLMLGKDMRVSANLILSASKGMGLRIYSNDDNEEALQDITVGMSNFNLDKVLSVIPYMPDVSGIMNGDFHVVQTKDELSVSSNLSIDNLVYEKCAMGDVGSEFVYMPLSDGRHAVDGILKYEGNEVATIKGTYQSEGDGYLDAKLGLEKLPFHFVNGFVPNQIVGLKGTGEGELTIKGALSKPQVDGEIYMDSAYLVSVPYGVSMRFDNDPVRIVGSKLLFENFMMYANNESPLNIQGSLDFSNLDRMMLDIRMRARNFLLVDAKENARSEAFGKTYVNFYGMMKGALSNLRMRGKLDVLGNTNMTYILRESELSTDTELDELVKFTDFNSKKEEPVVRPKLEGFDMLLTLSIDESARILCALNTDKSNYIDLVGGGDLRMSYNPTDNLQLTGKYTLSNGEMKYSLPIIPLKTFTIQDGSFIEFTGDAFNPTLSITATENVKATVNEGQGSGRTVDFRCGVKLSQTLSKPGIQFIISAPTDLSIQDELNTMSVEEQGKVAITMLASGMYLANGNTNAFSMNSALSSFLNSEINNIAGTAMRSIGLDIGMTVDNSVNAAGALHTDYNFKFAKRFFNNRLSFSVGGQVSSGAEMENSIKNDAFFNNIEVQYRLNDGASQYIRGFYNNNTYDWLEGQIGEYGVGFMWRRKLQRFRDIFRFKNESPVLMPKSVDAHPASAAKKDSVVAAPQESKK